MIDLRQGDCIELMATIQDGSIDMVLTDPPYGTTACKWDAVIPFEPMWEQLKRIIKPNGAIVMTASQPFTTSLIASNMEMFKYCWVWEKSRPGDIFNAKNKPLKAHEDIAVFSTGTTANGSKKRMNYFPQGLRAGGVKTNNPGAGETYAFKAHRPSTTKTHVTHGSNYPRSIIKIPNPNRKSLHPTQKPVALMEYLIKTYTNPGETVLDFTMGSGTTGVAAIKTGRRFVGFELDPGYFEIAKNRINAETKEFELT